MSGQWAFLLGTIVGVGSVALGCRLGRRDVPPRLALAAILAYALMAALISLGIWAHG